VLRPIVDPTARFGGPFSFVRQAAVCTA